MWIKKIIKEKKSEKHEIIFWLVNRLKKKFKKVLKKKERRKEKNNKVSTKDL